MELLLSDDFAVLLIRQVAQNVHRRLKRSKYPDRELPEGKEHERHRLLVVYLRRNREETQMQQDIVWSRFCALYLPATVDRLLDLPVAVDFPISGDAKSIEWQELASDFSVNNPWHEMLVAVQHTPYFSNCKQMGTRRLTGSKTQDEKEFDRAAALDPQFNASVRSVHIFLNGANGDDPRQSRILLLVLGDGTSPAIVPPVFREVAFDAAFMSRGKRRSVFFDSIRKRNRTWECADYLLLGRKERPRTDHFIKPLVFPADMRITKVQIVRYLDFSRGVRTPVV
ncbi:hypothetical protein C8J57DRAFT_1220726 [Mycena rebaudengoi]|nr:hypothetical protein C8J57DRAFT_1220726 [Mycena rebaudengoi]